VMIGWEQLVLVELVEEELKGRERCNSDYVCAIPLEKSS